MEARRDSRENTELFFPPSFTPPPLVPSCQAATMLSWSFFQSIGNRKGPPHGGRGGEGNGFGEEAEEEKEQNGIKN